MKTGREAVEECFFFPPVLLNAAWGRRPHIRVGCDDVAEEGVGLCFRGVPSGVGDWAV